MSRYLIRFCDAEDLQLLKDEVIEFPSFDDAIQFCNNQNDEDTSCKLYPKFLDETEEHHYRLNAKVKSECNRVIQGILKDDPFILNNIPDGLLTQLSRKLSRVYNQPNDTLNISRLELTPQQRAELLVSAKILDANGHYHKDYFSKETVDKSKIKHTNQVTTEPNLN